MNNNIGSVVFASILSPKKHNLFPFFFFSCLFLFVVQSLSAEPLIVKRDAATNRVIFVEPDVVASVADKDAQSQSPRTLKTETPAATAKAFLKKHGRVFGLRRTTRQLRVVKEETDSIGMTHVTYQQRGGRDGVLGGEIIVHIGKDGEVKSTNGQVANWVRTKYSPKLKSKAAVSIAKRRWTKHFSKTVSATVLSVTREIVARGLIDNTTKRANFLAWKVQLVNTGAWIDRTYYVDAKTGRIRLEIDNIKRLDRFVFDCSSRPGTDICSSNRELRYDNEWLGWTPPPEYYTFGCREGLCPRWIENPRYPSENSLDTDSLYEMFSGLHDFYWTKFQRNGANGSGGNTDGSGFVSLSSDSGSTYLNFVSGNDPNCIGGVFWSYAGIGFCQGFVYPDTVGHEYTHGVKPSLVYSGQSGALDESFSDVIGQMFELFVTEVTDWTTGSAPIYGNSRRSLSNPPVYSYPSTNPTTPYPDHFYSANFYCGSENNGGVHWNSTVPSKAAYLISEGGSFNGCAITGLGTEKLEQIIYRAVVYYYPNSVSFNGAYYNIISACNDLYSADDCAQVTAALQAVEMNQPGRCADPTQGLRVAPLCADQCPDDPNKTEPGQCGCGVADTDSDGDGIADCNDGCPSDPEKIAAGVCGCGVADTDSDNDGTPDCNDQCPNDPNKTQPGQCGCGVADIDSDGDGVANCNDGCPSDPNKTAPGVCGCGVADTDGDGDGTADCNDGCPSDPNKTQPGVCGCGVADTDGDGDGVANCNDGCPSDPIKTAPGACGCGVSDVDADGDGTADCNDGCPDDVNKIEPGVCDCGVADTDGNGNGIIDCLEQTISLQGTQSNDSITVTIGATAIDVRINSATTSYDLATVVGINIDALAGRDSIAINGGEANETATLSPGAVVLAGATYQINATNVETISVNAGGGSINEASLTGSAESNRLYSYKEYALLTDSLRTFSYRVDGFSSVAIKVPTTERNYAFFYDSPGQDSLEVEGDRVVFDRADGYTDISVRGFSRAYVYGTSGGEDIAALSGATDDSSRFYSYPNYCILTSTKGSSYVYVNGFAAVAASAEGTGTKYAYFYDGVGNDTLIATPYYTTIERESMSSQSASTTTATGFSRVYAYATRGGVDSAILVGSDSNNRFRAYPAYASLSDQLNSFYIYTRGFKSTDAYGSDDPSSNDMAYLYDSKGDDIFYGKDNYGYLADKAGVEFHNQANDFDRVFAYSTDRDTDDDVVIDGTISYYLYKSGTW